MAPEEVLSGQFHALAKLTSRKCPDTLCIGVWIGTRGSQPSIRLCVRMSTHIHLSIYISIYPSTYLSIILSFHLSIRPSIHRPSIPQKIKSLKYTHFSNQSWGYSYVHEVTVTAESTVSLCSRSQKPMI